MLSDRRSYGAPQPDMDSADRIIAEQIANRLQKAGYPVMTQLGRSNFKVNLAVALPSAPDCYRLGILIDGEAYRRTQTTRDREVVQPSVLGSLDWEVMRVWSPDWFRQPDLVIERILARLKSLPERPLKQQSTAVSSPFAITEADLIAEPISSSEALEYPATDSYTSTSLEDFVHEVVAREQPITYSLLSKRVAASSLLRELARRLRGSWMPYCPCSSLSLTVMVGLFGLHRKMVSSGRGTAPILRSQSVQ